MKRFFLLIFLLSFVLSATAQTASEGINYTTGIFAIIGDYGLSGPNEAAVANLVKSWSPEYILTTGDNNYPDGASSAIDRNIGQYYHNYIKPYSGGYGSAADVNRFYPCLGNHDVITAGGAPYFQYFTLPGNERYYDFIKGNVHFFAINSDPSEPNGTSSGSVQATWLKNKLAASTSKWKIVFFHHSPYTSDAVHGSQAWMQWPFKAWGADVVLSGHSHVYERVRRDSFTYFVNGLGGHSKYSLSPSPVSGSQIRYNANYGAMKVVVRQDTLWFKFYSVSNALIDSYPLVKATGTAICDAKITLAGSTTFCQGGSVTLKANTGNGFIYQWKKNGTDISGATAPTYIASSAGDYQLKVSFQGCTDWSAPLKVTVNTSLTAKITAGGPTTFCAGGKVTLYANTCNGYIYQWKKNGMNISGATGPVYYASTTGNYQVKIISGAAVAWSALAAVTVNACIEDGAIPETDQEPDTVIARSPGPEQKFHINVYPNPTTGLFSFDFCLEDSPEETLDLRVINSIGQFVYEQQLTQQKGCIKETIELDDRLPTGVYILQIRIGDKMENTKLLLKR